MARTRQPRISRALRELIDNAIEEDRAYAARWIAERLIQFAPHMGWYRSSGGDRVRPLASGGMVMIINTLAGWLITDDRWRSFVPDDPLPTGAHRHGQQVFFDSEEAAEKAAHNLPGDWRDPAGEPNR